MPDQLDDHMRAEHFHDVDGKLAKLEMKVDAMATMPLMKKADAALPLFRELLDLIRDLRNEMRAKV